MEEIKFNEFQKDALREIGNICAGNAATALSQLTNKKIEINVPEIYFLPVEKVPQIVGEEKLVVGLIVRILGDFPSIILLIFSHKDALELASLLTDRKPSNGGVITDMERSALKEIGVILANAYLGALSVFVKWGLVPTVPEIIEDMAGAMVDYILIELSNVSPYALLIKSEFSEATTKIIGHFFLLPNPKGLEVLLKATEI
ncbi:MAG: CheY-P-specific phosphatase CheC [Candidatus Omnitrophota bacterium]|nr:MAG: CheY-P-specific phosphatase CheC [Candidatus Omnitrophota bacterium]HDN86037.1 chemotaxis protein CheC [Candidatus Omnitrophota bacterium]